MRDGSTGFIFPSGHRHPRCRLQSRFYPTGPQRVHKTAKMAEKSFSGDNLAMPLSARNQFHGTVVSVKTGAVMSEVVVDIGGGHRIVSLISSSSVKRLKLRKGSSAIAVIKATEVIISTAESQDEV